MGFSKKEAVVRKKEETPQPVKKVVTIMKTTEDKNKRKLCNFSWLFKSYRIFVR